MPNIPYQPLDRNRRETRLVVLKDLETTTSRTNTAELPLKCKLITTSLDLFKEPLRNYLAYGANKLRNALTRSLKDQSYSKDFYALSYVWGDPAEVCNIDIDGTAVKINANLHAALRSIRNNTEFRVIWADALSINQNDNQEKSWQVEQMAVIYSRARATISWLGPSSADSQLGLETLNELGKKTSRFFWGIQEATEGGPPPRAIKNGVLDVIGDATCWTAIVNICTRPYWSRIWIFQEMACARDKYFLCGNFITKDIDRPISILLAWQAMHGVIHGKPLGSHCLSMVDSVQTFRFHGNFPSDAPYYIRPGTLHDMLVKLRKLNATQPRDKIYAPLEVATDKDQLGIVPDYSKDLALIFKETACALLREGCLAVLLSASLQDKILQVPSWVPDWSTDLDADPTRLYCADKGYSQRSSTLKAIPQLCDYVTLDGYFVGKISKICDACLVTAIDSWSAGKPTFRDWFNQIENAISLTTGKGNGDKKSKSGYNTPESIIVELLAAVGGTQPVWSLFQNPYLRAYKSLKLANSLESLVSDLNSDSYQRKDSELISCVKQIQQNLGTGSRPFQLDSGAMGLTWKDKERLEDLIVVIPGVSMPCVLRRLNTSGMVASGHYQLVGIAYIHGIMAGEFLKKNVGEPQSYSLG